MFCKCNNTVFLFHCLPTDLSVFTDKVGPPQQISMDMDDIGTSFGPFVQSSPSPKAYKLNRKPVSSKIKVIKVHTNDNDKSTEEAKEEINNDDSNLENVTVAAINTVDGVGGIEDNEDHDEDDDFADTLEDTSAVIDNDEDENDPDYEITSEKSILQTGRKVTPRKKAVSGKKKGRPRKNEHFSASGTKLDSSATETPQGTKRKRSTPDEEAKIKTFVREISDGEQDKGVGTFVY